MGRTDQLPQQTSLALVLKEWKGGREGRTDPKKNTGRLHLSSWRRGFKKLPHINLIWKRELAIAQKKQLKKSKLGK